MPAMIEGLGTSSGQCLAKLRSLVGAQAGAVAVYVGLTIPLFVGAGGLAVDLTGWYRAKRNIQSAADAAAYAAALNLAQQGLAQTRTLRRSRRPPTMRRPAMACRPR